MNLQTDQESLFHKRVTIVLLDLLNQLGIDNEKIKMLKGILKTVSDVPPFVFSMMGIEGNKVESILKEVKPYLEYLNEKEQLELIIDQLPKEKILFFINQVITRLEWVKNGNDAESGYKSE